MKKRKFSFLLEIATLCLCVTAIAIGVYSAKTASLNVGGTVAFQAHNCDVYVNATISQYLDENGVDPQSKEFVKGDSAGSFVNIHDTTTSFDFGNVFFDDINVIGNRPANYIIITIKLYNNSKYAVRASFVSTPFENSGITAVAENDALVLPANQSGYVEGQTINISLSISRQGLTNALKLAQSGAVILSCQKNYQTYTEQALKWDDSVGWYVEMGEVNSDLKALAGDALPEDLTMRWLPIMEKNSDGKYVKFDAKTIPTGKTKEDIKPQAGKSYYFISQSLLYNCYESTSTDPSWGQVFPSVGGYGIGYGMSWGFCLDDGDFKASYYDGNENVTLGNVNVNDYSVSNIRWYLNGYTDNVYHNADFKNESNKHYADNTSKLMSFSYVYGIDKSPIYNEIKARTLEDLYSDNGDGRTDVPETDIFINNKRIPTDYNSQDKLWLLSSNEAQTAWTSDDLRPTGMLGTDSAISTNGIDWWLRTPYREGGVGLVIGQNGYINDSYNAINCETVLDTLIVAFCLRPAFQVTI